MKVTRNSKEMRVLHRISELIRRKLVHISVMRSPRKNRDLPIKLTELIGYKRGKPIPMSHLISLLEFYGCSRQEIALWNVKISILTYRALKKAKGEENPHPEMDF